MSLTDPNTVKPPAVMAKPTKPSTAVLLQKYRTWSTWQCIWIVASSFIPFFVLWYLAYRSLALSYWITLLLTFAAAIFVVRIFTIQHDCSHGSIARSRRLNNLIGLICSLVSMIPYYEWRKHHILHHATAGHLDRRGHGDVYTMSVKEYQAASKWERFQYRLFRNPLVMFVLGPPLLVLVLRRVPSYTPKSWRRERRSVYVTNLALAAIFGELGLIIGFGPLVKVHLPIVIFTSMMGTWVFYIAHQFSNTYWEHTENWDYERAAMEGSSYYKLPSILRLLSNNIGLHHIHHAIPQISGYNLQRCLKENPYFQQVREIGMREALRSIRLALWDGESRQMVRFRDLKKQTQPVDSVRFARLRADVSGAEETCATNDQEKRVAGHWFDYFFLLLGSRKTLFAHGWGDEETIEQLMKTSDEWQPPQEIDIEWLPERRKRGMRIREGSFDSPISDGTLPAESRRAYVCLVLPESLPALNQSPVCVLLAASGDEGFSRRLQTLAYPLAQRGIGSLILENPFYGRRRPSGQRGHNVRSVSEFLAMFRATVEEARSLLVWLRAQGVESAGVMGTSMGGQAAGLVGATVRFPIAVVPFLSPSSIASQYAHGALSLSCIWEVLARQTGGEVSARCRLEQVMDVGNLLRLPSPVRTEAAILINARRDAYVPSYLARQLHEHWPGSEQRWVAGGHISSVLFSREDLIRAITDAFQRLSNLEKNVKKEGGIDVAE